MKKILKNKQEVLILFLVFLIPFLIFLGIAKLTNIWPFNNNWQAVFLTNGEIYFGHLIWLPRPHLLNVWYIKKTPVKDGKFKENLTSLNSIYWKPNDILYLESENIIWWTNLRKNSPIVKFIEKNKY